MFIFKIWNIIFPQASENENTGFNISRGKYAFKALPEPACNVNRRAINGSHRPQSGPALLQSCCWRLLVSQCEETPLSPHLLHVRVPRLKEHLLYSPAPHFPSSAGESRAWLSPAKIKCFSLVASCVAREIFSPMVPFCYYPSADGRGKARMCFVSWQGRGQGKAKPVPTGIFWLGFAACSLALLCSDYGPAWTSLRLEVTDVIFGEISNMWPLYRNGLLSSTSSGWAEGLEMLGLSHDRWCEAVLADAHREARLRWVGCSAWVSRHRWDTLRDVAVWNEAHRQCLNCWETSAGK